MKALGEDIPGYKLRDIIKEVDVDKNGTVEFNEFLEVSRYFSISIFQDWKVEKFVCIFDNKTADEVATDVFKLISIISITFPFTVWGLTDNQFHLYKIKLIAWQIAFHGMSISKHENYNAFYSLDVWVMFSFNDQSITI